MSAWIGLAGVVLGVLLGFGGELILARRQEARRLDDVRRELYAQFLSAVKASLDHLAEGALNRVNGAAARGEYGGTYVMDYEALLSAISGMELVSTEPVLERAQALASAHKDFATRETHADTGDRDAFAQTLDDLKRLSAINGEFLAAAQGELRLAALLGTEQRE